LNGKPKRQTRSVGALAAAPGKVSGRYTGSRLLDGNFTAVLQTAKPISLPNGSQHLREYLKTSETIVVMAQTIAKNYARGLSVAPAA
jgi:hypothetical protein